MKQQYQFDISPKNKCGIIIFRVDPRREIDLYMTGTCIAYNADCNQAQLISHVLREILGYTERKKMLIWHKESNINDHSRSFQHRPATNSCEIQYSLNGRFAGHIHGMKGVYLYVSNKSKCFLTQTKKYTNTLVWG